MLYHRTTWQIFFRLGVILILTALVIVPAPVSSAAFRPQNGERSRADTVPQAARRKTVIRQSSPATCGPAALATLFTVYFNDPVTELDMMRLAGTDKSTLWSIDQLSVTCSARHGYEAQGRRWNLPRLLRELDTNDVPVIAHLQAPTEHFLLVVDRVGDFLLLADPDRGDITVHRTDFLRRWSKRVVVVNSSRPVDNTLAAARKRSAERRLRTLNRANSLMSVPHF
jgi:predicted double-glycine peptidase